MEENIEEKVFIRVLECWVLDTLGVLETRDRELMEALNPRMQDIYGRDGDWKSIIAQEMEFPEKMPSMIREMYQKYQEDSEEGKVVLNPDDFARMFVRDNFVSEES